MTTPTARLLADSAPPPTSSPVASLEDLGKTFNTAILTTLADSSPQSGHDIHSAMESPAFHSLLSSVRHLSKTQGISEAAASEEIIRTVRTLDAAWKSYVFQQGLERLQG